MAEYNDDTFRFEIINVIHIFHLIEEQYKGKQILI